MRLPGRCTECGRYRYVIVSSSQLWKVSVGMTEGLCAQCEEEQDARTK
jgi:hypothetical protein